MVKFRVEYFNNKDNTMNVMTLEAEDSNELKKLWNEKYKNKGKLISACDQKIFNEMLNKYGDLMKPIDYKTKEE